jgi:hypothetical protein
VLVFVALAASAVLTAVLALALVREVRLRRALEALLTKLLITWRQFRDPKNDRATNCHRSRTDDACSDQL